MTTHAPSFTAAKLYRKQSKTGGTYFTGRLGGVKVALIKSNETADDGGEIWSLLFSEAAPWQGKSSDLPRDKPLSKRAARLDPQRPLDIEPAPSGPHHHDMNDPIPF